MDFFRLPPVNEVLSHLIQPKFTLKSIIAIQSPVPSILTDQNPGGIFHFLFTCTSRLLFMLLLEGKPNFPASILDF